jgi:hypothetical protein
LEHEPKSVVLGLWSEVDNLNHLATHVPFWYIKVLECICFRNDEFWFFSKLTILKYSSI